MIIGVPKETKPHEYRVGLTPESVKELIYTGHKVVIEQGAGLGIGINDSKYQEAGAEILQNIKEIFEKAKMIVKVKDPSLEECAYIREDQILFTFLHLAALPDVTQALLNSKVTAIAYETVTNKQGKLPILAPMSEVAGRMSVQVGAWAMERSRGGKGILLGGIPGVHRAKVVILGGGAAGTHAAQIAIGMGANVSILDISLDRLRDLDHIFAGRAQVLKANKTNIEQSVEVSDLVIGSVLVPGDKTPHLVTEQMIKNMEDGSVVVDISIDQGGCIETSIPTTHTDPIYIKHGVVHYCVTNIPGAVPRTSAYALNQIALDYIHLLANNSLEEAIYKEEGLLFGLNTYQGHITHPIVASALGLEYVSVQNLFHITSKLS